MELIIIAVVIVCVYFLPSMIAFGDDKKNKYAILVLNAFLGWTFIGWVMSMVWAACDDSN